MSCLWDILHWAPDKTNLGGIMSISAIGGFIVLVADIYAIVQILQSPAKGIEKLIWALAVFFLPLFGLIIWYFAGPGKKPF
jgi:hypothetical protein